MSYEEQKAQEQIEAGIYHEEWRLKKNGGTTMKGWNVVEYWDSCHWLEFGQIQNNCNYMDNESGICGKQLCPIKQPKSCPLYTDYKKSCQALKDRKAELRKTT